MLGIQLPDMDEDDGDFYVHPDNWPIVETFCRLSTQWRVGPMGGVIGLDYLGVKTVMDLTQPADQHKIMFESIQIMERVALEVLNSKYQ